MFGKPTADCGNGVREHSVGQARHATRRRGDAIRPVIERQEQRALDRRRVQRILELLAIALVGRAAGAVLVARDQVVACIRRVGKVGLAVGGRVEQRCRLHPVLVGRIDLDGQRAGVGRLALLVAAVDLAGDRIGRQHIGERKDVLDVQVVLAIALGAVGLREPVVEVDATARRNPLHQAVEHLLAVFRLVEAEVAEVVQEAAGLRGDFGVDALDVSGKRVGGAEIVDGRRSAATNSSRAPRRSRGRSRSGPWPCTRTRRCRWRRSCCRPGGSTFRSA